MSATMVRAVGLMAGIAVTPKRRPVGRHIILGMNTHIVSVQWSAQIVAVLFLNVRRSVAWQQ
jgi:hypothetical protein